jgi:hypothetical protein
MAPLIDDTQLIYSSTPSYQPDSLSSFRKENQHQPKSVSFSVMSDLYLIPHANDFKRKEKNATWMTKRDFQRIQKENFQTLQQMTDGSFPSSKTSYFRGLETLMPEARNKRKQRISFVVHTILREQQNNELSPQWLEEFQYSFTSKSAEAAYRKGVWDATEAVRNEALKNKTVVWI